MLDPDIILATGERTSRLALVEGRWLSMGGCGELRGVCSGFFVGLPLSGGCEASSGGGGAAGNLKCLEKEFEGFLPGVGRAGVLGVVVIPGRLLF